MIIVELNPFIFIEESFDEAFDKNGLREIEKRDDYANDKTQSNEAYYTFEKMVPAARLELASSKEREILNLLCIPIPPRWLTKLNLRSEIDFI